MMPLRSRAATPSLRPLVLALALVSMGSAACGPDSAPSSVAPATPRAVNVTHPSRGPVTRSIVLPATVRAFQEATLYAKVGGYLKAIAVDTGDPVQAGATLATLEVPELQADLARSQAELDEADKDARRQEQARGQAPNLVVAKSVDEARAKAAMARASVERIRTLLGYANVTAPFAGIVTKRWADPGAFIPAATASSTPQNSAIVTLSDWSRVRVQVPVPEAEMRLVAVGNPTRFTVEGLPGRDFEGAVTRFSHVLDEATRTMMAEVEVANADGALRPGMYAKVRLVLERKDDALLVPADAVLWEKGRASLLTVVDGKVRKAAVKTGFADTAHVEIVDGVDQSATVILAAGQALPDGQAVTATEKK